MRQAELEDLKRELWLREREQCEIIWTTSIGDKIPINRMSDKHLLNVIAMLESQEDAIEHIGDGENI